MIDACMIAPRSFICQQLGLRAACHLCLSCLGPLLASETGVFGKRGLFQKVSLRRGIGVRVKGVAGNDAIVAQ